MSSRDLHIFLIYHYKFPVISPVFTMGHDFIDMQTAEPLSCRSDPMTCAPFSQTTGSIWLNYDYNVISRRLLL